MSKPDQAISAPFRTRVRSYFLRHVQTLVGALGRMSRQPVASVMTIAVIGIALALPAGLHLLVVNGKALSGSWDTVADVSVYLERGTPAARLRELVNELRDWPEVASIDIITADEALGEFARQSGFGEALAALQSNPLPDMLVITPNKRFVEPDALASLAEALRLVPETDIVQIDTDWVERFNAILNLVRRTVGLTGVLLALGVILIVGNTIRLDIENRRSEIEVTKLVGGSDGFVRRPFLYSGFWYGLLGALLALLLVWLTLGLLHGPVSRLAGLYGSAFSLHGLGLEGTGILLGGGALLGWLGSWTATTRHLRHIEPA